MSQFKSKYQVTNRTSSTQIKQKSVRQHVTHDQGRNNSLVKNETPGPGVAA